MQFTMFATKRCANISNCTYQYLLPLVFIVKYWYICMPVIIIICTFTVRLLASISDVGFMASNSYYPPLNHPLSQLFPLLATSMAVVVKGPVGKSQGEHLQHACECRVPAICRAGNLIKWAPYICIYARGNEKFCLATHSFACYQNILWQNTGKYSKMPLLSSWNSLISFMQIFKQ